MIAVALPLIALGVFALGASYYLFGDEAEAYEPTESPSNLVTTKDAAGELVNAGGRFVFVGYRTPLYEVYQAMVAAASANPSLGFVYVNVGDAVDMFCPLPEAVVGIGHQSMNPDCFLGDAVNTAEEAVAVVGQMVVGSLANPAISPVAQPPGNS